jgi:pilus assembly protein CpaB
VTRRRLVAIIGAVVLALFGTAVLIVFVSSAEDRALEGAERVQILVASAEIDAGTPANTIDQVQLIEVPANMQPPDPVVDLETLGNQVTTQVILEGQTIVERQFGSPSDVRRPGGQQLEEGDEIITIALEPQRALGGQLSAGDLVGVMLSLDAGGGGGDDEAIASPDSERTATTGMVISGVPVTAVSGGANAETGEAGDTVTVSLSVDQTEAERIAFGMEFGRIWLTRQYDDAEPPNVGLRDEGNAFRGLSRAPE